MSKGERNIDRRTLLQLLPASALVPSAVAADNHCGSAAPASDNTGPYKWQFFTPEEAVLVDTLMEKIIPADEHSPGAHQARVVEFADLMISASPDYVKQDWRSALAQLAPGFKHEGSDEWLEAASQRESDPQTVVEIFFRTLKQMTINGYYSSAIGIHEELRYQGNTYVAEFHGCDHREHRS